MDFLLSPVILFFILGVVAALLGSTLTIPEAVGKGISLYLMAAIGLKGGVEVSSAGFSADLASAVVAGLLLGFLLPFPTYFVLRRLGGLDPVNAAAVAAHYGSVSVVTYVTGVEILTASGMPPAGYMVAVLALMEAPAIVAGLMLARSGGTDLGIERRELVREALLNGAVVLLAGGFVIGLLVGKQGFSAVEPLFQDAFRGILCLFLLDMGLLAARRLREGRALTIRLACFAVLFALVNGIVGVLVGTVIGLGAGSAAALGVLAGSASYIAVPAAMRLALPAANPGIYLSMSLAVTFPFNIIVGISLFAHLALSLAKLS